MDSGQVDSVDSSPKSSDGGPSIPSLRGRSISGELEPTAPFQHGMVLGEIRYGFLEKLFTHVFFTPKPRSRQ